MPWNHCCRRKVHQRRKFLDPAIETGILIRENWEGVVLHEVAGEKHPLVREKNDLIATGMTTSQFMEHHLLATQVDGFFPVIGFIWRHKLYPFECLASIGTQMTKHVQVGDSFFLHLVCLSGIGQDGGVPFEDLSTKGMFGMKVETMPCCV